MPNPISSTSPSACDPNIASCADLPPAVPATAASSPATINLEPVVITGDAGAQALLRSYDASQACGAEKQTARLACAAIGVALLNGENGLIGATAGAFHASVTCGKDLRALSDCGDAAETLQSFATQVVDDCHGRGGNVSAGSSRNEIICEVAP